MSRKDEYTQSEWMLLIRTLVETAGAVMAASPGGLIGETVATYQALNEIAAQHKGVELIDGLVANMTEMSEEERAALKGEESGVRSYDEVKYAFLNQLRQVRFILAQKATPDEQAAYKQAVQYVAERVANASKEGGFLGIGGTRYTETEQALVRGIEEVLGLDASADAPDMGQSVV